MTDLKPTSKYKHCNHHHELTENHEMVDFGNGEFVANKDGIPLLKALNEIGLKTRTHHIEKNKNGCFVSILVEKGVEIQTRQVQEKDSSREKYNGMTEVLIVWNSKGK